MDGALIVLVIVGWFISTLAKNAQRQNQSRRPSREPGVPARQEARKEVWRPARPTVADPPEWTDMPIQWGGTTDQAAFATDAESDGSPHQNPTDSMSGDGTGSEPGARAATIPGLGLVFNGDALVKGVVYAEILGRRAAGRRI